MTLAAMEPLRPNGQELRALALGVANRAERLGRHLHPATLTAVAGLLRTVNCYYSNLIEDHDTHPIAIERAMRQEYESGTVPRNLQIEALAHIETQKLLEERLIMEPTLNVCEAHLLRWIHRVFHERLRLELRLVHDPESGQEETVVPGEFRHFDVRAGEHIPPPHGDVETALARFSSVYDPNNHDRIEALVLLGAAHHRLLWIHPFGDGNGRVTRLMTDAYLRRIGVGGQGLWTASRGLARRRVDYKAALAAADAQRWDDYDGRGPGRTEHGWISPGSFSRCAPIKSTTWRVCSGWMASLNGYERMGAHGSWVCSLTITAESIGQHASTPR